MRTITLIIIHCTATKSGQAVSVKDVDSWHRKRGYGGIGYHYLVGLDGTVHEGRPIERVGAHCKRHNKYSIGICYVGGLDRFGRPADTRTPAQKAALYGLIKGLKQQFKNAYVVGHRDLSPDLNGDGRISPDEYIKECPCFNAMNEYGEFNANN